MYLTSFIHREELFHIAERWLCSRPEPDDGLHITQILICDGFVVWETVEALTDLLLGTVHGDSYRKQRIQIKGELRDAIYRDTRDTTPRLKTLMDLYRDNPDFFFLEAPINGVMCLDSRECLVGLYRIKRPRRIAEKSNRHVANWIFQMVQGKARKMAEERARILDIPLERLITPPDEMVREFRNAEEEIAQRFKESDISLDRDSMTIHDVGGIKIIADDEKLLHLQKVLREHPTIRVLNTENHSGNYRDTSLILEVPWDGEFLCRQYRDGCCWERYRDRGISEEELKKGLESFLKDAGPTLNIELILSTFPDLIESEFGNSIHEERIMAQRDNKPYKGYIPMNVEFLIEYLFAVGVSPKSHIDRLPIKLWGRYLPDTVASYIRCLYSVPEYEFLS